MDELIKLSLSEDLNTEGDITSKACIPSIDTGSAFLLSKANGIFYGHKVIRRILEIVDKDLKYVERIKDTEVICPNDKIADIYGNTISILTAERTLLNFIQRLSGVATITNSIVKSVSDYKVKILDSRKTTPGFRLLEKEAVVAGGGHNHRIGLYDQFLIKNNHIDALGGDVKLAIQKCRSYNPNTFLKVEVRDMNEINLALSENPDGLLLDNFPAKDLKPIVEEVRKLNNKIILEASGGINPSNIRDYAATGVDEISLGFITHSVPSLDISLRFAKS